MPMRTEDDIQKAHDQLLAIILGDVPSPFPPEHQSGLRVAASVLCWVLEHDHNTLFSDKLQTIDEFLADSGWVLMKEPNADPS